MSRIYLEVQVPGNARTYEFVADNRMTVGRVKRQFIRQISLVEGREIFTDPSDALFCSSQLEGLLGDNEKLEDVDVASGDTIILL